MNKILINRLKKLFLYEVIIELRDIFLLLFIHSYRNRLVKLFDRLNDFNLFFKFYFSQILII